MLMKTNDEELAPGSYNVIFRPDKTGKRLGDIVLYLRDENISNKVTVVLDTGEAAGLAAAIKQKLSEA